QGKLRELRVAAEKVRQAIGQLDRAVEDVATSWDFDEEAYLVGGDYTRELIERASQAGRRVSELDNRLYSYPALLRVLPAERAVLIDKARERRLRPTVLVQHLSDLQRRPPRSRSDAFLEALYNAYQ